MGEGKVCLFLKHSSVNWKLNLKMLVLYFLIDEYNVLTCSSIRPHGIFSLGIISNEALAIFFSNCCGPSTLN